MACESSGTVFSFFSFERQDKTVSPEAWHLSGSHAFGNYPGSWDHHGNPRNLR